MLKTLTSSLCAVNECLADISVCEHGGRLDVVPLLSAERINRLLLSALLANFAVLADSHIGVINLLCTLK